MMSVQLDLLQVSDAFSILRSATVQNCDFFSFAFVAEVLK